MNGARFKVQAPPKARWASRRPAYEHPYSLLFSTNFFLFFRVINVYTYSF